MLIIIQDTRETNPFLFKNIVRDKSNGGGPEEFMVIRETMNTGDYTINHCEQIVVERKAANDILSCVMGADRDRFEGEVMRANLYLRQMTIVVEQPLLSFKTHQSKVLFRTQVSWSLKYPRVHWFWASNRREAELVTFRILQKAHILKSEGKI